MVVNMTFPDRQLFELERVVGLNENKSGGAASLRKVATSSSTSLLSTESSTRRRSGQTSQLDESAFDGYDVCIFV